VTKNDIFNVEIIASNLVWKMIDFVKNGYTHVQKRGNVKSINEYVEEAKFGKAVA